MYTKYELPKIRFSIFYYDNDYFPHVGEQVQEILERYGFYPPEKIYADRLTKGKYIDYNTSLDSILREAYSQKEIFSVSMASGDCSKVKEMWDFLWNFTFYKNKKLAINPVFVPWNVLSLSITYGLLNDGNYYENFFECFKSIVSLISPIYACIDDISNSCNLSSSKPGKAFTPQRIQQIYWGNYFGKYHCEHYGKNNLLDLPIKNKIELADGVFFTLTDNVLDFSSLECKNNRRIINKVLEKTD